MRTVNGLREVFLCSEQEAAQCLRARDALIASAHLSEEEASAVEDYVVGLCLALGMRDGKYKVSPTTIFAIASMVIVLGDFGKSLNDWAAQTKEVLGPLLSQEPIAEEAWGRGYRGFIP